MESKPAFSLADLQKGAKALNTAVVETEKKAGAQTKDDAAASAATLDSLEKLYEKHAGNVDLIFDELGANPAKAKKSHHAPKTAREFALKFSKGYYDVIEGSLDDDAAESKSPSAHK